MRVQVIDRSNRADFGALIEAMHRHRHRIFVETLGWRGLDDAGNEERDAYDTLDATYLVVFDAAGELRGSARFLATTAPHMLDGPLKSFVAGDYPTGDATVEWSRHAPGDPSWPPEVNAAARLALNFGALEWAVARGVTGFVAVLETWLLPRARAFGWTCRPLGPPRQYGEGEAVAVHIPVDAATLTALRTRYGRFAPVLAMAA